MLRKSISITLGLVMLLSSMSVNGFAQTKSTNIPQKNTSYAPSFPKKLKDDSKCKPGEIIIKYKDKTPAEYKEKLEKKMFARTIKSDKNGSKLLKVSDFNLENELKMLKTDENIEYAVPNYIREANEFPIDYPNDPEFMNQWGLTNINAMEGWMNLGDTSKLQEVKVAVIDTGLDMSHEDLKDAISPDGYDFVDMDNDPSQGPVNEEHASHVAGIIAASVDNSIGVAGVSGKAPIKIMPLRVLEAGRGDDYTISQAITYAVDHGAKVINMSLGSYYESPYLHDTIQYALSKNVVVVVAAGNDDEQTGFCYPASIPGVTTVAASDFMNMKTYFSNHGPEVEIAAPGQFILSTIPGNKYEYYNGTSMSAPFIAAVSALVLSKNPNLSNIEVEQILTESAQDVGVAGKDNDSGYGILDLGKALSSNGTKAKIDILNLLDNSDVCGILDIQTRYTYPANLLRTELYVDDIKVDSIDAEQGKIIYTFDTDTCLYKDGKHNLKVHATDKSGQVYVKELNITTKNEVSSGLNVKITHNGAPVKGAYVDVFYKPVGSTNENEYERIYANYTSTSGVASMPGFKVPSGNEYLICANYAVMEGSTMKNVVQFKKTTAPGTVKLDETGLKPVTIDSGAINEDYNLFCNYKVPMSEQYIPLLLKYELEAGESKIYLSQGTYCFEGFTSQQNYSDIDPLYFLKTNDIRIGDMNNSILFEDRLQNLTKLNLGFKETPGFEFDSSCVSFHYKNLNCNNKIFFNESLRNLDVYMTPGMVNYYSEVVLENEEESFKNEFDGEKYISKGPAELFFGGNLSIDLKTEKELYLTGEKVNFKCNEIDGFGNRLIDSSHINNSYGPSSLIEILDNNNNVLLSKEYYSMSVTSFTLGQNLKEGSYVFRYTNNHPEVVQADARINISTAITDNAVKLKIGLPENRNIQSATINATNLSTGVTETFDADNFVDNNCYLPLVNGDYKVQIEAYDENDKKVIYFKDIKSPGFYDISAESLQKIELVVRDENGEISEKYANFILAQSGVGMPTTCFIDSYDYTAHSELYIQKGLYNIEAIVYSDYGFTVEGVLFKNDVSIGSGDDKENIDFNFDNVTELNLEANIRKESMSTIIRDKKTGLVCLIDYYGQNTVKVSKGSYKIDTLYTKLDMSRYNYILTTDKDLTENNAELNFGTNFTASLKLDKDTYFKNESIKTESRICDQYDNQLISFSFRKWYDLLTSQQSDGGNKNYVMGLQNGKVTLYDKKNKRHEAIDTLFESVYDPFIYVTDSYGNVVFSQKSSTFYTNGEINLQASKIKPGNYNIELSIDIAPGGSVSAKSGFEVIEE